MALSVYIMTRDRRARILRAAAARAQAGAGPPPKPGAPNWSGGEHVHCVACGEPIRLLSWTVGRPSKNSHKQYHYRCWRWGGLPPRRHTSAGASGRHAAPHVEAEAEAATPPRAGKPTL